MVIIIDDDGECECYGDEGHDDDDGDGDGDDSQVKARMEMSVMITIENVFFFASVCLFHFCPAQRFEPPSEDGHKPSVSKC